MGAAGELNGPGRWREAETTSLCGWAGQGGNEPGKGVMQAMTLVLRPTRFYLEIGVYSLMKAGLCWLGLASV